MPEPLLAVFKIFLLILLYLFFYRVLRAVWAEVTLAKGPGQGAVAPAKKVRRTRTRDRTPPRLKVLEPPELQGQTYPLGDAIEVGRAAGCNITIDDTFASARHARIFTRDGQLFVEDLGSTNGTYLNRRKVSGPMVVSRGDRIQIGSTIMELT